MLKFKIISWVTLFFLLSFITNTWSADFTASNLPVIVISTNGQTVSDTSEIIAEMGIIYNGSGVINKLTDAFNEYNGKISIKISGGSLQAKYPKKQYDIEMRDAIGFPTHVSVLEMPAESQWVLYAPYSDKTMLRSVLAYKLSNDMGRYASRTKFCEIVINGEYRGTYVLTEKIKPGKERVNIEQLTTYDNDITGGYIIKIDELTGEITNGWYSEYPSNNQKIFYQYYYPATSTITSDQKIYIQNYISQFEKTMKQTDYANTETGYHAYINTDSFADFIILNEIGKNVNAYRLNTFIHKDKEIYDGKLTMGPIWNFETAFGNANYYESSSVQGWQYDFSCPECIKDANQVTFWWKRLLEDPYFRHIIRYRWKELRKNILSLENISKFIDETADYLKESQTRNFEQWPILGKYVSPNEFIGKTYQEEVNYLKEWIQKRFEWMDEQWKIIPGDINEDGIVNLQDAILILQLCSESTPSSAIYKEADISGDEKLGMEEAVYILQAVGKMRQ